MAATAVAGFASIAATPAQAAVILMVGPTTITDNGPGDLNAALGQITSIDTPVDFTMTINTGTTTSIPSMDLSSTDITSTAAGSLVVQLTETGLTKSSPVTHWVTQFSGSWVGGAASAELQTYMDPSNTPFGQATPLTDLIGTSTPFALSFATNAGGGGPFSITEVLTINAQAAGETFSLDGSMADAPEPTSVGLVGAGLVGLAWVRRRKRKV
ncbi:MAG TPA: PEP-CTERM sorting domain-containing protein [Acetobacteraceae bacterium]|nr:PEP-CTERM sorting domain-containing protein [Acetobacteraceae bacterium]